MATKYDCESLFTPDVVLDDHVISNKDALRDKIHEIHNFLRNNGAGYGMNALKVFNILYGLKKIEENNLLDKVNLKRPECEFSQLLIMANAGKNEELVDLIYGPVLDSISESNVRDLLFYEIPRNIKSSSFSYLIKEINKITHIEKACNVLLSGKIYEYFIGRDESAISELGAYFTDRHITDYIFNKLKPEIYEDGTIGTMIDMFGGSGGFTTGYINYLNNNYEIDWSTQLEKIYHYDMNEDVIKSAALEFFCLTGIIPNMENIKYKNSFTDDFSDTCGRKFKKYDYVITNPPYGGDSHKKTGNQIKREKIKEHIKEELKICKNKKMIKLLNNQLQTILNEEKLDKNEQEKRKVSVNTCGNRIKKMASKNKLTGNDKESCSLMLMMDLLDHDGVCAGVLKEGVFFNKIYKNLRKYLIENFNVSEVISVPQDQFENTSTKTSIVIFSNTEEKTKEIVFREMMVEKYEYDLFDFIDDQIVLLENKGDIKCVSDKIISRVNVTELLENHICSLNGKDYCKQSIKAGKNYELVKLGDICNKLKKGNKLIKDKYNYVEISDINDNVLCNFETYDVDNIPNNCTNMVKCHNILIASVRPKPSKILLVTEAFINLDDYVFSSSLLRIDLIDSTLSYYIYAMLMILSETFEKDLCKGSSYPRFSMKELLDVQIPIPKKQSKLLEWTNKISKLYNKEIKKYNNEYNQLLMDLKNEAFKQHKYIKNIDLF